MERRVFFLDFKLSRIGFAVLPVVFLFSVKFCGETDARVNGPALSAWKHVTVCGLGSTSESREFSISLTEGELPPEPGKENDILELARRIALEVAQAYRKNADREELKFMMLVAAYNLSGLPEFYNEYVALARGELGKVSGKVAYLTSRTLMHPVIKRYAPVIEALEKAEDEVLRYRIALEYVARGREALPVTIAISGHPEKEVAFWGLWATLRIIRPSDLSAVKVLEKYARNKEDLQLALLRVDEIKNETGVRIAYRKCDVYREPSLQSVKEFTLEAGTGFYILNWNVDSRPLEIVRGGRPQLFDRIKVSKDGRVGYLPRHEGIVELFF